MQHKIIKGSDAIKIIDDLLKNEENRSADIALFKLDEVNLYINTVKAMQRDLDQILSGGFARIDLVSAKKEGWICLPVSYRDYIFCTKVKVNNTFEITITPTPPFEQLRDLLLELQQQKDYLEQHEKIHDKLTQRILIHQLDQKVSKLTIQPSAQALESLDEREGNEDKESKIDIDSIKDSIKDAQDQVALQALESYQGLVDQYKELTEKENTKMSQSRIYINLEKSKILANILEVNRSVILSIFSNLTLEQLYPLMLIDPKFEEIVQPIIRQRKIFGTQKFPKDLVSVIREYLSVKDLANLALINKPIQADTAYMLKSEKNRYIEIDKAYEQIKNGRHVTSIEVGKWMLETFNKLYDANLNIRDIGKLGSQLLGTLLLLHPLDLDKETAEKFFDKNLLENKIKNVRIDGLRNSDRFKLEVWHLELNLNGKAYLEKFYKTRYPNLNFKYHRLYGCLEFDFQDFMHSVIPVMKKLMNKHTNESNSDIIGYKRKRG